MKPQTQLLRSIILFLLILSSLDGYTQTSDSVVAPYAVDRFSVGLGGGIDYGGIGGQAVLYPQRNIGIFGGVGYALVGIGYNVGLKLRLPPAHKPPRTVPFLLVMYGYNTAIKVSDSYGNLLENDNKLFYGPSLGAGLDIYPRRHPAGYWTFDIILPIRSRDVNNYINSFGTPQSGPTKPLPVLISVGYHFIRTGP